jgi:hypothetical protein
MMSVSIFEMRTVETYSIRVISRPVRNSVLLFIQFFGCMRILVR